MTVDRCHCEAYAAVTERAALAGARWLGRGDVKGAEESAVTAMREVGATISTKFAQQPQVRTWLGEKQNGTTASVGEATVQTQAN